MSMDNGTDKTNTLKPSKEQVILSALNILFTVILPAAANVIAQLKKSNVTVDDLKLLKELVKRPEEYVGHDR